MHCSIQQTFTESLVQSRRMLKAGIQKYYNSIPREKKLLKIKSKPDMEFHSIEIEIHTAIVLIFFIDSFTVQSFNT